MYEYITSQSNIVQASIDILYIPKANGRTKGTMPIIKRMFQIRFFFMGFSKIERCKANLLNNFIHQRVTEHKYLPTASCSSCFSAYASIFLRKTARVAIKICASPSKQSTGRRLLEAQESIPHSAECGSRLCLENPQAFEKA
jgi:hypothetical protein